MYQDEKETPEIAVLYSGSKGNAILYRYDGRSILIDAGKNCKSLCEALERFGVKKLDGIFITHEHSDHISALGVYLKKHQTAVHVTSASLHSMQGMLPPDCAVEHPIRYSQSLDGIEISSFETPHDSRASVGYVISGGGVKIGIATDIGHMTDEIFEALSGCDTVVLEANHDLNMLMMGSYPYSLKQRIMSDRGHLSNDQCAECAVKLAREGTQNFILAHLSETNNLPYLAYDAVRLALDESGFSACRVVVAKQDSSVGIFKNSNTEALKCEK